MLMKTEWFGQKTFFRMCDVLYVGQCKTDSRQGEYEVVISRGGVKQSVLMDMDRGDPPLDEFLDSWDRSGHVTPEH